MGSSNADDTPPSATRRTHTAWVDVGARGSRAPKRGFSALSAFSANTLLIVACCVIFFLDGCLAKVPVQVSKWRVAAGQSQAWDDLHRAHGAMTQIAFPPGAHGVGKIFVWAGDLPPKIVLEIDPIAEADYQLVSPLRAWLQFTTAQAIMSFAPDGTVQGLQFWRFIGYGFLHFDLTHLAFNMVGLFVFGPIVEERFGRRRYLAVFSVSVVAGALLFLVLNALGIAVAGDSDIQIPGLLSSDPFTPLIGASGGVYGIILAAAWLAPEEEILLLYLIPMRIRVLALLLLALAVWALLSSSRNAGGEAAHLGGAIAGWWVARRPHVIDDFFDLFGRRISPRTARPLPIDGREVDSILDKADTLGLSALTERERAMLRAATEALRRHESDGR